MNCDCCTCTYESCSCKNEGSTCAYERMWNEMEKRNTDLSQMAIYASNRNKDSVSLKNNDDKEIKREAFLKWE